MVYKGRYMFRKKAFTMIELMIGLAILCMVLTGVHSIFSYIRSQYMHGTVNLQSFEDARLAINHLRRDYSTACPYINYKYDMDPTSDVSEYYSTGIQNDFIKLQKMRRDVFDIGSDKGIGEADKNGEKSFTEAFPIQIVKDSDGSVQMTFHHFIFQDNDSCAQMPLVEEVKYFFDKKTSTLQRESNGKTRVYKGFDNVDFSVYILNLDGKEETDSSYQDLPVLWVYFDIHDTSSNQNQKYGSSLQLGTSIVSQYIAGWMQNRRWRSDIGQQKK